MAKEFRTGIIITGDANGAIKAVAATDEELRKLSDTQEKSNRRARQLAGSMNGLAKELLAVGGVIGGALGLRQVVSYADTWSDLSSRVRLAIGEHESVSGTMDRLSSIARVTYSSLEATADSFARNANTLSSLGKSTQEQLAYTEALNNALVVSGAKGDRLTLVQDSLNRAMAEGSLRGQDLQNVLNYGTEVAQALADELGVSVTQLRGLAAEGKITGDVIFQALVGRMDALREKAESMPATIGDAFTLIRNAVLKTIGVFDQQAQLSGRVAESLVWVSDHVGSLLTVLAAAGTGWAAYASATMVAEAWMHRARIAQALLNSTVLANPYVAAAAAVAALGVALYGFRDTLIDVGDEQVRLKDLMRATWLEVKTLAEDGARLVKAAWDSLPDAAAISWRDVLDTVTYYLGAVAEVQKAWTNSFIGAWMALRETVVIVTQYIYQQFSNAFAAMLDVGQAFKQDLSAIFSGDFSFSRFRAAVAEGITEPTIDAARQIADAWKANLSRDWVGGALQGLEDFWGRVRATAMELRDAREATEEQAEAVGSLGEASKGAAAATSELTKETRKLVETALDKYLDAEDKASRQREKSIEDLRIEVSQLERKLRVVGQGEEAQKALNRQLYEESVLRSELYQKALPGQRAEVLALMMAQYDLKQALDEQQASHQALETSVTRGFERMRDAVGDFFQKMVLDGKAHLSDLLDTFKKMIAEMLATAAANKIMIAVSPGGVSGSAKASGGGAGGLGGLFSLASLANAGKSLWGGFTGLLSGQGLAGFGSTFAGVLGAVDKVGMVVSNGLNGLGGAFARLAWGLESAGYTIGELFNLSGLGAGTATVLGSLASVGAGSAGGWLGSALGRDLFGKQGSGLGAAGGAIIGTFLGGPLGAALGGAIGGLVDSIFGSSAWQTTRGGIELGFTDAGFDPRAWERQTKKGGLFSSTKRRTIYSDLDPDLRDMLDAGYDAMVTGIAELYGQIGVAVSESALESVRIAALQIGTAGKSQQTEEEIQQQVSDWFTQLAEAMVGSVDAALTPERLAALATSLSGVNRVLDMLGLRLFDVSKHGAEAADALLTAAGGMESFAAASDFYYQNFYSEQERQRRLVKDFTGVLDLFNAEFGTAIKAKDDLRYFIEALSDSGLMATEAGRQAYIAAMNLAPVVAGLSDALDALGSEGREAAAQLAGLFSSTYEQILLDGMKADGERYSYFKAQADALAATFDSLTDPAQILAVGQQYNQILSRAYASLSEESQDLMREELLKTVQAVDEKLRERLSAPVEPAGPQPGEESARKIDEAIARLQAEHEREVANLQRLVAEQAEAQRQAARDMAAYVERFGAFTATLPGNINVTLSIPEVGSY